MAKLYFRYGTVNSAKTLSLLTTAYNYRQANKKVLLLKPEIDTRFGPDLIKTRAGLEAKADLLIPAVGPMEFPALDDVSAILVDEAQFAPPEVIDQLHKIVHACTYKPYQRVGIPVLCYGLRTDFRRLMFPGAQRLMELADSIEEIKTICSYCLHKAVFNLKIRDGQPVTDGPTVELGGTELYLPVCGSCYDHQYSPAPARKILRPMVSRPS